MPAGAAGVVERAFLCAVEPVGEDRELRVALAALEAGQARPYYDGEADSKLREGSYSPVGGIPAGDQLRSGLSGLLGATHTSAQHYKPSELVYPWVDLHPDRQLRSVYSGKAFAPEEFIEQDLQIERARTQRLQALVQRTVAVGPRELEAEFDRLEAELPFNCEHVVPQSWFAKKEPMRGDLHHLFACETGCNSFRANTPFGEFPDFMKVVLQECGKSEGGALSPLRARGPSRARCSTSCFATPTRWAALPAGSTRRGSRCCSPGTRRSPSATVSATETPRSQSCRETATR